MSRFFLATSRIVLLTLAALAGCLEPSPEEKHPLRPLIYTEQPNQSPLMMKAREERLLRELQGSEQKAPIPPVKIADTNALGRAILHAVAHQDHERFEQLFIDPESLAFTRGISLAEAADTIDQSIGESEQFFHQFDPGPASERRKQGLLDVVKFDQFRTSPSVLSVRLIMGSTTYTFEVADVLKVGDQYRLAGPIKPNEEFARLRALGVHLRPEVLLPEAYWFPMSVGNFWRYRLSDRDVTRDLGKFEQGLEDSDGATTRTVQVTSIERLDTRRLAQLKVSFDDEDATTRIERWLLLPTAIFECPQECVERFSDLGKLLQWLGAQSPLFVHPIKRNQTYSKFEIVGEEDTIVPTGKFDGTWVLRTKRPTQNMPMQIWFKPGVGVVKQKFDRSRRPFASLIDYRLMLE